MSRGTLMALVAMGMAVFVVANDFTAPSVTLPAIEHDFDANVGTVQWVINAYALVFGVLIVTGGRLADRLGRRRAFLIGAAIFGAFSTLAGAAPGITSLILARGAMGIGGALMWPAVLGMTYTALPEDKSGLAGGLIIGVAGIGNAVGPLLGGVLSDELTWRWLFFLNVPIAAIASLFAWRYIHQPRPEASGERFDRLGVATLSVALSALLIALDQSADWGWGDPRTVALLVTAAVLLPAFVVIERRAGAAALVPPDVMRNRGFAGPAIAVLLMSAVFFVVLLFIPQFMEKFLGYSALKAGLGLLPLMLVFALTSFTAGTLYERLGARLLVGIGGLCLPVGLFLVSLIGDGSHYLALVPGMVVLGLGVGLFYSSITTAAVTALDPSRASLAGGIVYMCQICGGALGLGTTTAIVVGVQQSRVADDALGGRLSGAEQHAVQGVLAGTDSADALVARFPSAAAHLEQLARDAFVAGLHAGFRVFAAVALIGLAVAVTSVGRQAAGEKRAK